MDRSEEPATLVRALIETTARIEAASLRLSAAELELSPVPGGWSFNQVLWHIRATADVYAEQISRILAEDQPHWRHVSPRARMKKARYDEVSFIESFEAFAHQRSNLVALLDSLAPGAWQRCAIVCVDQIARRLTLQERVRGMASHEGVHCAQVEQLGSTSSGPRAEEKIAREDRGAP